MKFHPNFAAPPNTRHRLWDRSLLSCLVAIRRDLSPGPHLLIPLQIPFLLCRHVDLFYRPTMVSSRVVDQEGLTVANTGHTWDMVD